jgi:hypothetical protein
MKSLRDRATMVNNDTMHFSNICMSIYAPKGISGDIFEIRQQLDKIEFGEHIILIYPNLDSLREIYSHYCRRAIENNELVLLLTYYETANRVRQTLKEIGIDSERYEKERTLIIIEDVTKSHFSSSQDFLFFLKRLDEQQEKLDRRNGTSVIAYMGIFYHIRNKTSKNALIRFEKSLPTKFDINLKRVCNYHKYDFDRLEEQEKKDLLEHHYRQIRVLHPMID